MIVAFMNVRYWSIDLCQT